MSSPDQLIQQIRFGLASLGETNGHHEFEHVCRFLARAVICPNILPATGPVSAGGDQGRDFETFRTFVYSLDDGSFCGTAAGRKIVFACSLDQNIPGKVKQDVTTIMAGGTKPDIIYFFSSHPLPVAKRHTLQSWARSKYHIELEILDRNAIADQLAEAEQFWIAARYLGVPSEVFPRAENTGSEYEHLREKWFQADAAPSRFAEFIELKRGARWALDDIRQDLPQWLSLLDQFLEHCEEGDVGRRQAYYELIVLNFRMRRSFRGDEDRVRRYFAEFTDFEFPDITEEAETVRSYGKSACLLGEADFLENELSQWRNRILAATEHGIANPISTNQLCLWLKLRGRIAMHDSIHRFSLANFESALGPWFRLIDLLPDAPLFPVEDFHDDIMSMAEIMEEVSAFDRILEALRPILSARAGNSALADSHFRRAQQLLKKKRTSAAIGELHAAKIKWFSEETIGYAAQCCLLLARCYQNLGLNFAAIYYDLAASYIFANGHESMRSHISDGLHDAVESAYRQGHWCLYYELAGPTLAVQYSTSPEGLVPGEDLHLDSYIRNLSLAIFATRKLSPEVYELVMSEFRRKGMESVVSDAVAHVAQQLSAWTDTEFEQAFENSLAGPPFADAGATCVAIWSSHGIRWEFSWINDYSVQRVALEFVSFIQIALADLAEVDLDIIPGTFRADVKLTDKPGIISQFEPDNTCCRWQFELPSEPVMSETGLAEFRRQLLGCLCEVIRAISAMPNERFLKVFTRDLQPKLFSHDFFARRFPELLDFFAGRERFDAVGRLGATCPFDRSEWISRSEDVIPGLDGPHPDFDEEVALQRIAKRYEVLSRTLRFSLPRLAASGKFRSVVAELRHRGWKDWHILMATSNLIAHLRVTARLGTSADRRAYAEAMRCEIFGTETADSEEVPIEELTSKMLDLHLMMSLLSTLATDGLYFHHPTPNRLGLYEYARQRWRYFDLDIDHPPYFPDGS